MDEAQRKRQRKLEAIRDEDDLFDLGEPDTVNEARAEAVRTIPRSPLLLLVLLHSPNFPLSPYVAPRARKRPATTTRTFVIADGRERNVNLHGNGSVTVFSDEHPEGTTRPSLSEAAWEYAKGRKKSSPNGWDFVRVGDLLTGKSWTLSRFLELNWDTLEREPDTLDTAEGCMERLRELGVEEHAERHYDKAVAYYKGLRTKAEKKEKP